MEPLSVGASVIAVVGATRKLIKGVRRLKALQEAPRELDDLLVEISQFELIINAVQNTQENRRPEIRNLLATATDVLVEFESLIEYDLTKAGTSDKVDRWQWTRKSKGVERLRGKLRDITANVVALVGVNTSTTIHEVAQTTNQVLAEHRQLNNQILPAVNLLVELLEESAPTRAALTNSLGNVRQLTVRSSNEENDPLTKHVQDTRSQAISAVPKTQCQSMFNVTTTQTVRSCDVYCECKCHARRRLGVSGTFLKFFGHGYVEVAGFGLLGPKCDTKMCRADTTPYISVQYCLPQWLAYRMLFMWFTSSPPCGPELLLRVPRVLSDENLAIRAIYGNDVEKLKLAISRGDCTPYDVNEFGMSLLELTASNWRWEILHYLSGQDDYRNSSSVGTVVELRILSYIRETRYFVSYDDEITEWQDLVLNEDLPMIDWERCAKMQSFTTTHQIIIGIIGLSLDVELQSPVDIDRLDKYGRSALWYAVALRRLTYVRRLLEHGADPNIGDPPLWAVTSGLASYEITKLLFDHGASLSPDLIPSRKDGWLPWPSFDRIWGYGVDDIKVDTLLIDNGIYINHLAMWQNVEDVTILMRLSSVKCLCPEKMIQVQVQRVEQLISVGADLEITDKEGKTAIMYAAMYKSAGTFRLLAGAGARHDLRTVTGKTILHLAISGRSMSWGYKPVKDLCAVMREVDLTSIDLDAEDEDGNTAYDLLRIRNEQGIGLHDIDDDDTEWWLKYELEDIKALEDLLHHVQDVQGVPKAEQYPTLGEYRSRDPEDREVPGAWPVYED